SEQSGTMSDAEPALPHVASGPPSSHAVCRAGQMGLVALALLLAAAGVRAYVNAEQARTVRDATEHHALRSVLVESPRPPEGSRTVSLPATLRGQHQAAIHARTNGYVRAWMKDIGDQVRKGDVLAIIDTPEVDQDLAQALAATQQVQARLDLATS